MAYNSHAHACCLYGPSLTSNLQSLQRAQIDVIWLSEGEVSSHTGGRNKRKAALPATSLCCVTALVSCCCKGRGLDLAAFPNDAVFWATHEVAQAPTSGVRRLPPSKRQEERVIKLRSRKEEKKEEDQSAAFSRRREASRRLKCRPPQNSNGDKCDEAAGPPEGKL